MNLLTGASLLALAKSIYYTFETEKKKAFQKAKKEHQPNLLFPLCIFFNDIYSHLQHVRQADLFF